MGQTLAPLVIEKVPWYRSRRINALLMALFLAGVAWGSIQCLAWGRAWISQKSESKSIGTTASGSLEAGRSLAPVGEGYRTYSILASAWGRQYVHGKVADSVTVAMGIRGKVENGRIFVLGDTGWRQGGDFPPHKTHQNGLSVDIMMPVRKDGKVAESPCHPWAQYGYGNEFDETGNMGNYVIDFESLAGLLLEIERQAATRGLRIEKIILAPEYVSKLLGSKNGRNFGRLERAVSRKPAWIRHDEHVHLDFALL